MLKRKSIIIASVSGLLLIGGAYIATHPLSFSAKETYDPEKNTPSLLRSENFKKISEIDSDSDGLKDWEESLWKTDPKNPDTDSDGTPDGEEVKTGRNPSVAGPNDIFEKPTIRQNASSTESTRVTDRFSQEFFLRYLEEKRAAGGTLGPAEQQKIIEGLIEGKNLTPEYRLHTSTELRLIEGGGAGTLKKYGDDMGVALIRNIKNSEDIIEILDRVITKNDPEELKKIADYAESFEAIIKESILVSVPKEAVIIQLDILNSYERIYENLKGMSALYNDPILALAHIKEYTTSAEALTGALYSLASFFDAKGILFTDRDAGYIFTRSIL